MKKILKNKLSFPFNIMIQHEKTGLQKEPVFQFCLIIYFLLSLLVFSVPVYGAERLQQWRNHIPVIVIDPGHGGENEGTTENHRLEKDMTLVTALSMYEELAKHDGVEVYLTRTEDIDLSLKSRAKFAADVQADLLISLHYNASVDHDLFGAEAWIPSAFPLNNYAYQFAYEFLKPLQERGLFIRGIKTKLNDRGQDYYGIIREAASLDIPAVILEHCHVDEARDEIYCATMEDCVRFGQEDAAALLRYIEGISLQEIPQDYPIVSTFADDSPPDICSIELETEDPESGFLSFNVTAADSDSCLIYYDYSLDNGVTFSELNPWPGSNALTGAFSDSFTWSIRVASGCRPNIIFRAYNLFDQCAESNLYLSPYVFRYGEEEAEEADAKTPYVNTSKPDKATETESLTTQIESKDLRLPVFILFSILFALGVILIAYASLGCVYFRRRSRKKRAYKRKKQ